MKANFLAVGLVVRSTIIKNEYLYTIYTYKNKIHYRYQIYDIQIYHAKHFAQQNVVLFLFVWYDLSNMVLFPALHALLLYQMKARIVQLESQLVDERKKSEELQFSIDEAQFCGDEMNVRVGNIYPKLRELCIGWRLL